MTISSSKIVNDDDANDKRSNSMTPPYNERKASDRSLSRRLLYLRRAEEADGFVHQGDELRPLYLEEEERGGHRILSSVHSYNNPKKVPVRLKR